MTMLWLLATLLTLGFGALGERYLRVRADRQNAKLKALVERLNVYDNYNKLATLRRAEVEETLSALNEEVAAAQADVRGRQSALEAVESQAPLEFHCFDRVPRADGQLWYVAVEALDDKAPWIGVKHYALVAETPEEARRRIQERHPTPSSFAIGQPTPLSLAG
ncbi:hypothetical protein [Azospirillum sp.]|uniref:hypothetical protein n=1 Tax=Azospirillum sp. TaxID=34012 RepID=UPI00262F61EF|nr:hypothetical protein [Azospirillum sp.]